MADACRELNTPVTGGNVSFYNEFEGKAVYPSPVIGMVGIIDSIDSVTRSGFKTPGDQIVLIEPDGVMLHLGGSHYLEHVEGRIVGPCPDIDLGEARALVEIMLSLIHGKLINSAHDISEGGLAVALCECILRSAEKVGAVISLPERERCDIELFSEAQSRVVVTADCAHMKSIQDLCSRKGFCAQRIGMVVEEPLLSVKPVIDVCFKDMLSSYERLPWK